MSIKINIGSLKDGSQELDFDIPPEELELNNSESWGINGNLNVNLELFKSNHQLDIKANINGDFRFECDRCLDLYNKNFTQEMELVYVQKSPREDAYNDDYLRTYNPNMRTIDITNDIKEMILLAVPMRRVPDEKEDGSCSWCGKTKEYWNQFITEENEEF